MPEETTTAALAPSRRKVLKLAAWGVPVIAAAVAVPAATASTDAPATEPARGVLAVPTDAGDAIIQPHNLTPYLQWGGTGDNRVFTVAGNFGLALKYPALTGAVTVALKLSVDGQSAETITLSKDLTRQADWNGVLFAFGTELRPGQQYSVSSIISGVLYSYRSQTTWNDVFGSWVLPVTAHATASASCPS